MNLEFMFQHQRTLLNEGFTAHEVQQRCDSVLCLGMVLVIWPPYPP